MNYVYLFKNCFSLSLIFSQILLLPLNLPWRKPGFPLKYYFLCNSIQFWPLLQPLSNFKGKEEISVNSLFPTAPSRYLIPATFQRILFLTLFRGVAGHTQDTLPRENVQSSCWVSTRPSSLISWTQLSGYGRDTWPKTHQSDSLSLRNLKLEYAWCKRLWKMVLKIA